MRRQIDAAVRQSVQRVIGERDELVDVQPAKVADVDLVGGVVARGRAGAVDDPARPRLDPVADQSWTRLVHASALTASCSGRSSRSAMAGGYPGTHALLNASHPQTMHP